MNRHRRRWRLAWGIAMEGEPAGALRMLCVALILAGVAGPKLGS